MFNAAILGFIGAMIPGPLLSAIFTDILQQGLKKSLRTIFYAFFAETLMGFAILVTFSYASLSPVVFGVLSTLGACVLIWVAKGLWKITSLDSENQIQFNFAKVSLLTLTNGLFWIYWITVCIPLALNLESKIKGGKYLFLAMDEMGWLLGTLLLSFLFSNFRPFLLKEKVIKLTFKIFSLMFIGFALNILFQTYVKLF